MRCMQIKKSFDGVVPFIQCVAPLPIQTVPGIIINLGSFVDFFCYLIVSIAVRFCRITLFIKLFFARFKAFSG